MRYENMTLKQQQDAVALAEAKIAKLRICDRFTVKFTARGQRDAKITRIGREQKRFFRSWDKTNQCWGSERKLTAYDLIP